MLLGKWRFFCEGRPPSVQVYNSTEPPDALAPGPFAPALPPGVPLVQPILPPSMPTAQQTLPLLGTSGGFAASPVVPQTGLGLAKAGSFNLCSQQQSQQLPQLALSNISQTIANMALSQVASHGGVDIGVNGIPMLPGALATGGLPLQTVHVDAAGHPATHPLVQKVAGAVFGSVHAQQTPTMAVVADRTTVVHGAHGQHGGLVRGPAALCASSGGGRSGLQPGRRRQRARPQGRRL
mmetsp:Transcript_130114/g.259547  ORF Transcript_130114/g.259547 Transcript_130114/m.259547 type:complete len:237 (+) Transcript_130114:3-713(+)